MKCDRCNINDANIIIKYIVDNKINEIHLCPACGKILGVAAGMGEVNFSFPNIINENIIKALDQLEKSVNVNTGLFVPDKSDGIVCEGCQMTMKDFRERGKLGCNRCYTFFNEQLDQLFRRIQSKEVHYGRIKGQKPEDIEIRAAREEISRLQKEISKAVEKEDYQRAAICKSKMERLKEKISSYQSRDDNPEMAKTDLLSTEGE